MEDKRESAKEKNKIEEMINEEIEGRLENEHAKGLKAKGVDGKEGKENRGNKQETDTNSKQQPKRLRPKGSV